MTDFFTKLQARLSKPQGSSPAKRTAKSTEPQGTGQVQNGKASPKPHPQNQSPASRKSVEPPIKPIYERWWAWAILATTAVVGGGAIAAVATYHQIESQLPPSERALTFVRDGTLTIKAADGSVLQQLGPATREKLAYQDIPPQLVEAFIASEDRKFYEHNGVDYQAIARAVVTNIAAGEVVEGASTITQQLARIVFLGQEQTLDRKVREAMMAQKMERELTKQQILERYLNLVYLGSGAYGVADAAWVFYSKSVDQLTLSEMALIAGLAPAPSSYSPLVNPDLARERRDIVLDRMVEAGYITQAEAAQAKSDPLNLKPSLPRMLYSETPYFTSYVQQELPKLVSADELEAGGLTVETTLDPKWQKLAQDTIAKAIARYGRGQRFSGAALVSLDPRTGEIKALVGGDDFNESQFNRATQAMRQPGSTFKAFVYATAIASGLSPYKTYLDSPFKVDGYEPQNYSRKHSGNMTMRAALIQSVNVIAVKALIEVGFQPVIDVATKMGIKSKLIPAYSLALGTSEVNLLELTSAYGTFANRGKHVEPHGIVRIINRFGKVIYEADFEPVQALDQDSADIMTWMLRGVVTEGTGGNAALRGRPVAGKTGTSEQKRDLWFIGYIPQVVTGVWLGNDNNRPTAGASSTAALVWRNFMAEAVADLPVENFPSLPRLTGRERTVTRQPIKPRRMTVGPNPGGSDEAESESRRERRRYRDNAAEDETQLQDEAPSSSKRQEQRERRRRAESAAPVIEPAAPAQPAPVIDTPPPPVERPVEVAPPPPAPPAPVESRPAEPAPLPPVAPPVTGEPAPQ